jgi:tRNA(Ile)-lysidine synthetase-like protein
MDQPLLQQAIASIPTGKWAVGVSGGADSVALLSMLRTRDDLKLHVVHLDHQTREGASGKDAAFVENLARLWDVPFHLARRDQFESQLKDLPSNLAARFRRLRFDWFRRVVDQEQLDGVILAHHADDQAETVLLRLLRGSGFAGLAAMTWDTRIGGVRVIRPLLGVPRKMLREHLAQIGQMWREDVSNQSPKYARNRIRRALDSHGPLRDALLDLSRACRSLRDWTRQIAPTLPDRFAVEPLASLPTILARVSASRWLRSHGAKTNDLTPAVLYRLIDMSRDAATPSRQQFPGSVTVRRRSGQMWAE